MKKHISWLLLLVLLLNCVAVVPASAETPKLTFFTALGGKVSEQLTSWNDIACWPYIEEKLNVDIEFQHPAVGSESESFSLMLTQSVLPDIISGEWRTFQGVGAQKAIDDGLIIPLNDLLEEHAPNFMKLMEDNPEWKRQATTDEGVFYGFPYIYQSRLANSFVGFQIRQDWLDKLDLTMPANIDEWYSVLKAFKENDLNGNGEADEIPFAPSPNHNRISAFKLAYGLSPYFNGFYLDKNGKVQHTYLAEEYASYLKTMAAWYAEGLIDPEYITLDRNMLTSKMTSNLVGSTYAGYGMGFLGNWTSIMRNAGDEDYFLVGSVFPETADGVAHGYSDLYVTPSFYAISADCKNPELAVQLFDYLYSPEGHYVINFGPDETVYEVVDGKAVYKDSALIIGNTGLPIDGVLVQQGMACNGGPFVQDEAYARLVVSTYEGQAIAAENYMKADIDWMIPAISHSSEESSELSTIITDMETLMNEFETKVIMGLDSVDNLPAMLENVKSMGIERAIELKQNAVDRYFSR